MFFQLYVHAFVDCMFFQKRSFKQTFVVMRVP